MLLRVMRVMCPHITKTMVSAGRSSERSDCNGLAFSGIMLVSGRMLSQVAKIRIMKIPVINSGNDTANKVPTVMIWSGSRSRKRPDQTAQQNTRWHRYDKSQQRQSQRIPQPLQQDRTRRHVHTLRIAKVAAQQIPHPLTIAHNRGAIQTQFGPLDGNIFGRGILAQNHRGLCRRAVPNQG